MGLAGYLGDSEIPHQGMTRLEEDVLGFYIPVHKPVFVGVLEGIADLPCDADRLIERKAGLPVEAGPEGLALHEGHDEVEETVGFSGVVESEDVGVVKPGNGFDLPMEPFRP